MIDGKTVLAIIPARGGSKGVPRKNIRKVAGKPLIGWTIEEARKSKYIDRLVLSSDDQQIIRVAKSWGCEVPFIRPTALAQDDTPGIDPVLHAIKKMAGYEIVVLLQATSPLRNVADIDGCIEQCVRNDANACVSVVQAEQNPYWMYELNAEGNLQPLIRTGQTFTRRQDIPPLYILNGAIYVARCNWLCKYKTFVTEETLGFVMPQERSLDIDTEADLMKFRTHIRKMSKQCRS